MCYNMKQIHRSGKYKENNYNGKKGEPYEIIAFSKCGYCEQCKNEKANNWVIRNMYETKEHKKICFITLTYKENPYFLLRDDIILFNKRLRRHLEYNGYKDKIKVFYAGEYGTLHNRPHFHEIIYGWEEEESKLKYLGINKKNNVILQSETIEKVWGKGRTTIQFFNEHEIPYITLYQRKKETEAKGYLMTREKIKELLSEIKKSEKVFGRFNPHAEKMYKELKKQLKLKEHRKTEYICIKEFNGWSKSLGWNAFIKEYKKYKNYDFMEYIEDREIPTPTSWVKKLANNGDEQAIKNMLLRAQELTSQLKISAELQSKINLVDVLAKNTKEIVKYHEEENKFIL